MFQDKADTIYDQLERTISELNELKKRHQQLESKNLLLEKCLHLEHSKNLQHTVCLPFKNGSMTRHLYVTYIRQLVNETDTSRLYHLSPLYGAFHAEHASLFKLPMCEGNLDVPCICSCHSQLCKAWMQHTSRSASLKS